MFSELYNDWNHKRSKAIVNYYGYKFFFGKKVLDLGAGHGDIGAVFLRLGAEVTCVDIRNENLREINVKYPAIKTVKLDLDNEWPFHRNEFDIVVSTGLLCHLKNYEDHIKNLCDVAECIILETEVLDNQSPDQRVIIYEEKTINDLSFHGQGSIVSAVNIQNKLSSLGAVFKRIDDGKMNSGPYKYDWREENFGRKFGNRRMWFIRRDKFLSQKLENEIKIQEAEKRLDEESKIDVIPPLPPRIIPPTYNERPTHLPGLPARGPGTIESKIPTHIVDIPLNSEEAIREKYFLHSPHKSLIPDSKIRIFINYFDGEDVTTKEHANTCMSNNLANSPSLYDLSITHQKDITFSALFYRINDITGDHDINIICTSNVFFDDTILLANNINRNEVYALTCWDWSSDIITFDNSSNRQNVWIVRGKINNVIGDFFLGAPGADGRIAYEFHKAKYKIYNPSKSIKAYRMNNVFETPSGKVCGPYLHIIPSVF